VFRQQSWRVLGTWVDVLGYVGAFWACPIAVGEHLPFAVVAMAYLVGQVTQAIPVPGGVGAIDAGVTGAVVLYGGEASLTGAGEVIAHGLAVVIGLLVGAVAGMLLPAEIKRTRRRPSMPDSPTVST
jgi:uncharacterized membrane protein YbhN (UPF0104 family)